MSNSKKRKQEDWVGYGHHFSVTSFRKNCDEKKFIENLKTLAVKDCVRGQLEKCEETGEEHWQIYYYTQKSYDRVTMLARCRDLFADPSVHVKVCTDRDHAIATYHYAHKDSTSLGEDYRISVHEDILPEYISGSEKVDEKKSRPLRLKREVHLWFGPPATGKSYRATKLAQDVHGGSVFYCAASSGNSKSRWLGDYKGEAVVIIDEFDPKQFDDNTLKMLLDRQPQRLTTVQGGRSCMFDPAVIILINNWDVATAKNWVSSPIWSTRVTSAEFMNTPVPSHLMPAVCKLINF